MLIALLNLDKRKTHSGQFHTQFPSDGGMWKLLHEQVMVKTQSEQMIKRRKPENSKTIADVAQFKELKK